jgi:hypothetical protein
VTGCASDDGVEAALGIELSEGLAEEAGSELSLDGADDLLAVVGELGGEFFVGSVEDVPADGLGEILVLFDVGPFLIDFGDHLGLSLAHAVFDVAALLIHLV